MTRRITLTRRELVIAGATALAGLPARASWAAHGAHRETLRLVFFTDVHARVEWDTPRAMARAARAINAKQADLVIAGGDLITDGFQSGVDAVEHRWQAYMAMHEVVRPMVASVIGNHDLVAAIPEDGSPAAADPRAVFRARMGVDRTYRSLDAGGYHFVILDSIEVTGGRLKYAGRVDATQREWLRRDLEALDPAIPLVVATHIPLLTAFQQATEGATSAPPANRVIVNNLEVLELFSDRNLVLVLQGHTHVDEVLRWRGTTFITGGAVCGKWWRGPWHGTREGFGVVTLRPDRVDWEYVHYGWDARGP